MALKIEELKKELEGGEYISDARLCVTADGEVVDQSDPRAVRLLVGVGGTLSAAEAAQYGLTAEPKEAPTPSPKTIAFLESANADLAAQLETANGNVARLTGEVEGAKSEARAATEGHENVSKQLNEANATVTTLQARIAELEGQLAAQPDEKASKAKGKEGE